MNDPQTTAQINKAYQFCVIGVGIFLIFLIQLLMNDSGVRVGKIISGAGAFLLVCVGLSKGVFFLTKPVKTAMILCGTLLSVLTISSFLSIDRSYSFRAFYTQHIWFFFFLIIVAIWCRTPDRELWLFRGFAFAALYAAIAGIVLYYIKAEDYIYLSFDEDGNPYYRAEGLLGSYTRSGILYIVLLPGTLAVLLQALKEKRHWETTLMFAVFAFSIWYLILTHSRGPWIACLISVLTTFVFLKGRFWIPVVLIGMVLVSLIAVPPARDRAATFIRDLDDPELLFAYRFTLWEQGLSHFKVHPWFGLGHSGRIHTRDYAREKVHPDDELGRFELYSDRDQSDLHNHYLQWLVEVGIIGSLAYYALLGFLIWNGIIRLRHRENSGLVGYKVSLSILLALSIYGIIYYFGQQSHGKLIWLTMGLLIALPEENQPSGNSDLSQDPQV